MSVTEKIPAFFKRRRRPLLSTAAVALLFAVIILSLPYGLRRQASQWLREHGSPSASIENLRFNLFTGRLIIESLGAGEGDDRRLILKKTSVIADWLPFFQKRVQLRDVSLSGMEIDLERREDGSILIGGLILPPQPEAVEPETDQAKMPWGFGLGALNLENVVLRYRDSLLETDIVIHKLHIDPAATWLPDERTAVAIDLELNSGRLTFQGTMQPFARTAAIEGNLKIAGIQMRRLVKSLERKGIENLDARLTADTRVAVQIGPDDQLLDVVLDGLLAIDGVHGKAPAWELAGGAAQWKGRLHIAGSSDGIKTQADGKLSILNVQGQLVDPPWQFNEKEITWQGLVELDKNQAVATGQLIFSGLDLAAASGRLKKITLAQAALEKARLQITPLAQEPVITFTAETRLQDFLAETSDPAQTVAGNSLSWTGNANFSKETTNITGSLSAKELSVTSQAGTYSALALETLPFTAEFAKETANIKGSLSASGITGQASHTDFALESLAFTAEELTMSGPVAERTTAIKGTLELKNLAAALDNPAVKTVQQTVSWQGSINLTGDKIKQQGLIASTGIKVANGETAQPFLEAGALHAANVRIDGLDSILAEKISLEKITAIPAKAADAQETFDLGLASVAADQIILNKLTRLTVEKMQFTGLQALVKLDAEGRPEALGALTLTAGQTSSSPAPEKAPATATPADKDGFTLAVRAVDLVGDNRLIFRDNSVQPPFSIALQPVSLHIENLNSAEPGEKARIEFLAQSGQYESIQIDGVLQPFTGRPTTSVQGKIKAMNLAPLSPYAEKHIGYVLRSGMLDADLDIRMDEGIMDSEASLVINTLRLDPLSPEDADKLTKERGTEIPVETALSLLRDRDDNIRLKLPVKGDIRDPDIDIGDAVRQAVANGTVAALKTGVMVYFAPLGAVVMAGKMLGYATALRFNPVEFAPGSAALDDEKLQYLNEMARLLADRPETRLLLCGVVEKSDVIFFEEQARLASAKTGSSLWQKIVALKSGPKAGVDSTLQPPEETAKETGGGKTAAAPTAIPEEKLRLLGTQRAEAVRDHLAARGIPPERLIVCTPEIERKGEGTPRLTVSL